MVHIDNLLKKNKVVYIIEDDLGNMLRILLEIPFDIKLKIFVNNDKNIKTEYLKPMDIHPIHNKQDIEKVNIGWATKLTYNIYKEVNIFMQYCINKYDLNLFNNKSEKKNIVIIERKIQYGFNTISYKENKYKNIMKTSGSERRSIINHNELVNLIKKYFDNYNVINISTEYMPIFEQYIIFNTADIVFAQHGAALANILFMQENKNVIEIISKVKLNSGDDWFKPISKVCNINHFQYITEEEHTNINSKDFKSFLKELF